MILAIYNKNGKRNIKAENSILNGIIGAIPAALVGGVFGAIVSIAAGLFSANKAYDSVESAEHRKMLAKLDRMSEEHEQFKPTDKWGWYSDNELNKILFEKYWKNNNIWSKEHNEFIIVKYIHHNSIECDGDIEKKTLIDYNTEQLIGKVVFLTFRDFFRKFGDRIENDCNSIKPIDCRMSKVCESVHFTGEINERKAKHLLDSRYYLIDGIYYAPQFEDLAIKEFRDRNRY